MKKYMIIAVLCFSVLAGCKTNTDVVEKENVTYLIENEEIAVADYTKMDFNKTMPSTPTDEEVKNYKTFLLESYEDETGNDLGEEKIVTEDVVHWLTQDETATVEEFDELVKNTLATYHNNQSFYNDLNTIYLYIMDNSELKKKDEIAFNEAKEQEEKYFEVSAIASGMDLDTYKAEVMGFESEEDYEDYIEANATDTLKSDKVIQAISEKEGIVVTDEEYQDYVSEATEYYNYETKEDLMEVYSEKQLRMDILYDKVLEYIYNLK